jgi:hypothetical protein
MARYADGKAYHAFAVIEAWIVVESTFIDVDLAIGALPT